MGQADDGLDGVGSWGRCQDTDLGCDVSESLWWRRQDQRLFLRLPHNISRLFGVHRDKMAAVFVGLCRSASGQPVAWQLFICVSYCDSTLIKAAISNFCWSPLCFD